MSSEQIKTTKRHDDFVNHRRFANDLSNVIDNARREYEEYIASSDNPKKLFKHIRCSLSSKVSVPLLKKTDGNLCNNDQETAEALANHFSQVFSLEPTGDIPVSHDARTATSLCNVEFSPAIVNENLKKIKSNSSPGIDNLSAMLLKEYLLWLYLYPLL
ncbi:unnamed protein product [Psylliodes chrysocephalus]|uniref:Uncharacterized protein n=1 Tax=Psylliodes chrysocephalus TaxID=3402493 RepID=A0A9P0G887_9CUCU|nr:unnamed protein product [Psylliodes chrysocephala]